VAEGLEYGRISFEFAEEVDRLSDADEVTNSMRRTMTPFGLELFGFFARVPSPGERLDTMVLARQTPEMAEWLNIYEDGRYAEVDPIMRRLRHAVMPFEHDEVPYDADSRAVELKQRFPLQDITVLNRGVNGDETEDMMARFATGVVAAHPQLVLWQVGTNSVLRDHPLAPHSAQLHEGIEELKATGADVVLIDPQYAPKVLVKSETPGMVEQIAAAAKEENVDLFQRFAVMRSWFEVQHLPFDTFVSPDGLHMNDWGYACVAKLLATGIAEAATRPVASAAAHGH